MDSMASLPLLERIAFSATDEGKLFAEKTDRRIAKGDYG